MAKSKDINVQLAEEDQDLVASRSRAEAHQNAIAAEDKAQRVAAAQQSIGIVSPKVLVTITKFGEGKVSTGEHIPSVGDVKAAKGDILKVSDDVASDLEKRGFAERE